MSGADLEPKFHDLSGSQVGNACLIPETTQL